MAKPKILQQIENLENNRYYQGASAPSDTSFLWINTTNNTVNYYDDTTSTWKPLGAVYS